jgi:SAM-dependent methyltransferase
MDEVKEPARRDTASGRLIESLRPDIWTEQGDSGYIDLLGDREAIGSGYSQRVFRGKVQPRIYERLSRPIVARLVFYGRKLSAADERALTMDLLGVSSGEKVLDVGCGTGDFTRSFAAQAGDGLTIGLDASKTMLAAAVEKGGPENLAYLRADACELPFNPDDFDAVCCIGCLHILEDPFKCLSEMVRVARPGGRVLIGSSWRKGKASKWGPGGMVRFGRDELTEALSERGCVDITQEVYGKGQFVLARKSMA